MRSDILQRALEKRPNCLVRREAGMDQTCDCDHPDISLLRVVLIGEIVCADEETLYSLAEFCESIGLLQVVDEDSHPPLPPLPPKKPSHAVLRRIK
jgi:hypothetical protein